MGLKSKNPHRYAVRVFLISVARRGIEPLFPG